MGFAFEGTGLENDLLNQIARSFESAKAKKHGETSASGATFVYSGDKLFIAKKVRTSEYDAMADHLFEKIATHARLKSAPCRRTGGENCWAKIALEHTMLSLPLLAFKYTGVSPKES